MTLVLHAVVRRAFGKQVSLWPFALLGSRRHRRTTANLPTGRQACGLRIQEHSFVK